MHIEGNEDDFSKRDPRVPHSQFDDLRKSPTATRRGLWLFHPKLEAPRVTTSSPPRLRPLALFLQLLSSIFKFTLSAYFRTCLGLVPALGLDLSRQRFYSANFVKSADGAVVGRYRLSASTNGQAAEFRPFLLHIPRPPDTSLALVFLRHSRHCQSCRTRARQIPHSPTAGKQRNRQFRRDRF